MVAALVSDFVELGLERDEAAVVAALARSGSATAAEVADLAAVPMERATQLLDRLRGQRLAQAVPCAPAPLWACPGPEELVERISALQQRRRADERSRTLTQRLTQSLVELSPAGPTDDRPWTELLGGPGQVKRVYEELLAGARSELLMFTRPPYAWAMPTPNASVFGMLARGVTARVLYLRAKWEDPAASDFRTEMAAYHSAGVQARLAEDLPVKLVVVDRRATLVATKSKGAYPHALLIDDAGYATVQAAAFGQYWASARALPPGSGTG